MDEFSYLSVLVSIILGLGITQILTGVGRVIHARSRIQWYGPTLGWVGLLLIIHIQTWWAMFGLRTHEHWNFFGFLVVLLHPVTLYLLAALVLPEIPSDGKVDLPANYFGQSRWFFGLAVLVILLSLARPLALDGTINTDLDAKIQLGFLAMAAGAAITRRDGYHKWMLGLTAILFALYVGTLFVKLR